jgi:hypothetical protein
VQLPCATSAAMPMLSHSGGGWLVLPMSAASAPISIASAISAPGGVRVMKFDQTMMGFLANRIEVVNLKNVLSDQSRM